MIKFDKFQLAPSSYFTQLKMDEELENFTRQVIDSHGSLASPVSYSHSKVIHTSQIFAEDLGFTTNDLKSQSFENMVTGQNRYGGASFAMNYGGHQFGHWAGQLGDGRAINIGQIPSALGTMQLQLKGAGPTPYSRRGDGFAVLRSSIREHLCSEAMHQLGIPTTRSLSLALSGDQVYRDKFYDGNGAYEQGAIVCRAAPSFIRFGNFEIHAANGDLQSLKDLADFTINQYFAGITGSSSNRYIELFEQVAHLTLEMIMNWQRVGFVHGVMNTDNMSILGLTIDYGPYGWLDNFDPHWTPNTTDNQHKRYRYAAQPEIGLWNLWKLANSLSLLVKNTAALEKILDTYKENYRGARMKMFNDKLGLISSHPQNNLIIDQLEDLLSIHETDMTIFYRLLINVEYNQTIKEAWSIINPSFYDLDQMDAAVRERWNLWITKYLECLERQSEHAAQRVKIMQQNNPKYVLRNYMAQLAINDAVNGNYQLIEEFYKMLSKPYTDQPEMDRWFARRPDWARNMPGSSQLSCSS